MTHRSILSAAACAALTLAASSLQLRAELKPEDLYAAVSPSIVSLEVENVAGKHFVGSAFLALGPNLAVTAWHVVQDARRVQARFADDHRVEVVGVVDKNEALDLALIKLRSGNRPQLKLNAGTPRIGSRVYVLGSPRGFDFSIGEGLISQIRTVEGVRYYQLSCPVSPGNSGGPIVNERGEAIGVMSWRKADAENLGFAVPCAQAIRLNAALPALAWQEETVPDSSPSAGSPAPGPTVRATVPAASDTPAASYQDFLGFLSSRPGQRLTVTVEDARGKETQFSFEVPKPAGK
jgi:serine protease Do